MKRPPIPHDMAEAVAFLEQSKHWTLKTINKNGQRYGYECTIWADGSRVSATSNQTPFTAVKSAFQKLNKSPFKVIK